MANVAKTREAALKEANSRLSSIIEDITNNYMVSSDPAEAVAMMAMPILDAENFEDMFAGAGNVDDLQESLLNIGLHVEEISFNKSDFTDGLPVYATFRGKVLSTGDSFVANCGAWQVVLVAYQCVKNGWLPRNFCFIRSEKATSRGYHPVNICPWDEF